MTCSHFQAELPGYHLAIIDAEARDALEAHLLGCPACVAAFIALKRSMELGDTRADAPAPSAAARTRLRAAVAAELDRPARSWRWWERPLAVTLATAATLLAFFTVTQLSTRAARPPHSLADR